MTGAGANDHRLGLLNGTRAVITAVHAHTSVMSMHTDDERQMTIPVAWAGTHLDHGYAMTCHKAPGATLDTALLYGTGALTREIGYVALSRGCTANHLFVPNDHDDEVAVVKTSGTLTGSPRGSPSLNVRPWLSASCGGP